MLQNSNLANHLEEKKAVWHKSCRLNYSKSRAEKLRCQEQAIEASTSSVENCKEQVSDNNTRRRSKRKESVEEFACFLCDSVDLSTNLHSVSTFKANERIHAAAKHLNDHKLLAKLSVGDLIAAEAKYHTKCLVRLYNDEKSLNSQRNASCKSSWVESVAFAELCDYIKSTVAINSKVVLPLQDLYNLMSNRMVELGDPCDVHKTRFKEKLIDEFPDLEVSKCGRQIVFLQNAFTFPTDYENDYNDAKILLKASKIVRKNLFEKKVAIDDVNQKDSVTPKLVTLIDMILQGTNLQSSSQGISQAVLTISQLIRFNSVKR